MAPIVDDHTNSYELSINERRGLYEISATVHGDIPKQICSKEELLQMHARNVALLAKSPPTSKELVLPEAYSPSINSLDTLQKISFRDLRLETHHWGCFVTARTITDPYNSSDLITLIEEEDGTIVKLVIGFEDFTQPSFTPGLPINSTVAIKEPYCKFNGDGDYFIRVDHLSDIAILRGDDPAVSMIMQFVSEKKEITPLQWKNAGDKAYLEKKYASAIECYTQALDTAPKDDTAFAKDTLRKRGFANLTAKSYLAAKEDAVASCSGDHLDVKAYFCAGRAAYELGQYDEAKIFFEKALELSPEDPKSLKELSRATNRMREQEQGDYDFKSMVQSVLSGNVNLDHADYLKSAVVKSSPGHGRGLFSSRPIKRGELVLCEKAMCLPDMYRTDKGNELVMYNFNTVSRTQRPSQAALFLQLLEKLYHNPLLNKKYFELDGGKYIRSGKEGQLVDGAPIVDTFLVEAIRLRNCFSAPRLSLELLHTYLKTNDTEMTTGLWVRASYNNHACIPNCGRSFIGDMMVIHATCDIPADTELTHQYVDKDALFTTRRAVFPQQWEFECDCRLCTGEKHSPDEKHFERRDLVEKIKSEALKTASKSRIPSSTIKTIERLTKKLEELHEPQIYDHLPRLMLIHPCIWLLEAHRATKNYSKIVRYALETLRNFGFEDPVRDGKLVLEYGKGITNSEAFNALRYAAEAYEGLGLIELKKECLDAAKGMFVILTGSDVGIEDFFHAEG